MRERESNRGGGSYRSIMIVLAVFVVIVSISNIVLFHVMHVDTHMGTKDLHSFMHISSHHSATKSTSASSTSGQQQHHHQQQQQQQQHQDNGKKQSSTREESHMVAGLSCADHGGPSDEIADQMVFWSDIEADSEYKSPFYDEEKYISFEPDHGGFNNIRMAMETVLVLAHAMGRTLVLPPKKGMYLLGKGKSHENLFSFNDFFHLDAIAIEHQGLNIITMETFLERKGITGQLKSITSGQVIKPPNGITDWNGKSPSKLWQYLETVGEFPQGWRPDTCVAVIPSSSDPKNVQELENMMKDILNEGPLPNPDKGDFDGNPTPVDAPTKERLKEMLATRKDLCIYDNELQNVELIHFKIDHKEKARMLTHFYAFVFFQDWKQDLWTKRFVRDHIRYIDEIVCAAARIVSAVREKAKALSPQNALGTYNSFHVRRGDFQYKRVKIGVDELYERSKDKLEEGSFLYIATDERNKSFFDPLKEHYNLGYLDDYMHLIKGINPNYYGMLDQLVAFKGEVFFGTWFSTLTGYINRMRGYYNTKVKGDGHEEGIINSYYFVPNDKKEQMTKYRAVKLPIYMREFPVSWRDIDKGIGEL